MDTQKTLSLIDDVLYMAQKSPQLSSRIIILMKNTKR